MVQKERKTNVIALAIVMSFILVFSFAMAFLTIAPAMNTAYAAWDGEGNGTAESPYQIGTAAQLKKFRDIVNGTNGERKNEYACASLTADIDLACSEEDQWVPIGALDDSDVYLDYKTNELGYLGVFDGNGHTISGLYYYDTESKWNYAVNDYIGLFGVVGREDDDSGIIRNLTVAGSLTADEHVGGIAGVLYGTVDNCVNNVTVTGDQSIGGIVGRAMPGSVIRRSTNNGAVTGFATLGGIVGYIQGYYNGEVGLSIPSLVVNCVNNGALNVTTYSYIGGIAGCLNSYVSIVYCYNAGAITLDSSSTYYPSDSSVGGIVGSCGGVSGNDNYDDAQALVENCYNIGDITGAQNGSISGIVGAAGNSAMIRCCLNYGTLTITADTSSSKKTYGGVASKSFYSGGEATVKNVYYKEGTAQFDGNATKKSSEELKNKETFKDTSWGSTGYYLDFDFCWKIGDVGPVFISADSLDVAYAISRIKRFINYEDYHFPDDGPMIYAAKKAYDLLSDEQKATIPEESGNKLAEAVTVYAVLEKIHSVGKIYYSTAVKEHLDAAQDAYDALSVEWKQRLPEYEVSDLNFYQRQYENAVALYDYLGRQGIGSDEDPFLISTKEQLARINDVISASYKLVCDIDAGCDADHQWLPIGTYQGIENDSYLRWTPYYGDKSEARKFTGVLDGDGHTISNLYIDVSDKLGDNDYTYDHYAALICSVEKGGKVKNLTVEGTFIGKGQIGGITAFNDGIIDGCVNKVNVVGSAYMGGIAAKNYGQIINCKNFASVDGTTVQEGLYVASTYGGIVGLTQNGIVKNCTNSGDVTGPYRTGGIAGYNSWGQIWYCSNSGNVTGETNTGGIVGYMESPTDWFDFPVMKCYNAGTIVGTSDYTGGIVGHIEKPYGAEETGIENTYNTGSIQGTDYVGGLIGNLPYGCKIRISHNVGTVSGTGSNVGQLTGKQESGSEIFISYYRSDTDTNSYAMTTEKFKNLSNFGGDSGYWKNGEVWMQGDDYPIFISAEMIKAREVSTYIGNIGEVSYTPGSKERIVAAKEAYDNLTEEEKALVPQEEREALEKAINDYNTVEAVVLLIDAIGEVSYPDSKDAIDAAKDAVSDLDNDQKAMLGDHENDLKEAEADYAAGAIDAIGEVTYLDSKDAIDAAKAAVADLDDDQLALVGNLGDLKDAEADYAAGAIDAIGDVTYPDSKDAIDAAKAAVADLDDGQLALVGNLGDLEDAEKLYDAMGKIGAIGDVSYPDSKDAIDAAKAAVAALDDGQLGLVGNLGDLKDAEVEFAKGAIGAIGDVSYPGSKDAIDAAKAAIADLDDDQLALVSNLGDLEDAEKLYDAMGKISAIGDVSYPGSKDAIDAAKAAVADLDDDQLASVGNLDDLKDAEVDFAKGAIDAIGAVSYPGSKDAIDAAKDAVADLDDDQLALVSNLGDLKDAEVEFAKGAIGAIGEVSYPGSKDAIDAAKAAIADLDEDQLALVDNLGDLKDAEVDFAKGAIAAIGEVNYPGSKDAIDAAKAAVADLDEDQLALVDNLDDLYNVEAAFAKSAIDAIGEVSYPDSKDKIVAAREAYEAVDDEYKQFVNNYGKLADAEEKFVENVEALIEAIGTVEYSAECEEKIDIANNAFDALSEHLKSLVENADVLTQANEDYNAVDDAVSAIKAIGQVYYVDEIKNYIDHARESVDGLSDYQKTILPEEYLKILVDDEAAYEAMGKINAISLPLENTKDCLDKVEDADVFFKGLTEDQQNLVKPAFVSKLNAAVTVKNAIDAVNAIGEVENTPEDKALIDNARELIDAVLGIDKIAGLLPDSVVKDLEDKEAAYDALGMIATIGTPENTEAFREKVANAREAFDDLTDDQKELVNESFVKELEDAEAIVGAMDKINKIGEVEYTEDCKDKIDAAREAYDALTEDQKAIIPADVLKTLADAEKAYDAMDKIYKIGTVEYTAESKAKIDTAMDAFEALTPEQKELVSNHTELPAARVAYNELAANSVETLIAAIGDTKNPKSKEAIQEARAAYDGLTEEQKELVGNYGILTETEESYASYEKKVRISTAMGWVIFVLVILELLYLALYFILWYPKAGAVAKKLKLDRIKSLLNKNVLFGFIDLLLLVGSAASVVIFILALAALAVYATPIAIATFVLAFLAMAAYGVLIFFKWKKRGTEEDSAGGSEDPDNTEAAEPVEEEERDEDVIVVTENGATFRIQFVKSFTAKLIQSGDETKSYYQELKNEILSYKGVRNRVSWHYESFNEGRNQLVKIAVRGKTLCLYFALDMKDFKGSKYRVELCESAKYAAVPCMYRIKNDRRCEYAKDLIAMVMEKFGLVKGEQQIVEYSFPYENNEALLAKGLIKEVKSKIAQPVANEHIRLRSVSVREADRAMSDEVAATFIQDDVDSKVHEGKKGIINIDVIGKAFNDGDTVDIEALWEKKLIPLNVGYVKVLARGALDKKLNVDLQDYSIQAVKMIALKGGTVKKAR